MKSILYVGATLMIGASIYGFVDYKKTSHSKEFSNMYEAKEVTEPAVTASGKNEATVKTGAVAKEKKAVIKKQPAIKKEAAQINLSVKEFVTPAEKIATETTTVNTATLAESNTEKKYKAAKKKKLNHKLFSRAPLEDRYLEKELKPESPKKEPRKTKNKEQ